MKNHVIDNESRQAAITKWFTNRTIHQNNIDITILQTEFSEEVRETRINKEEVAYVRVEYLYIEYSITVTKSIVVPPLYIMTEEHWLKSIASKRIKLILQNYFGYTSDMGQVLPKCKTYRGLDLLRTFKPLNL